MNINESLDDIVFIYEANFKLAEDNINRNIDVCTKGKIDPANRELLRELIRSEFMCIRNNSHGKLFKEELRQLVGREDGSG